MAIKEENKILLGIILRLIKFDKKKKFKKAAKIFFGRQFVSFSKL